MKKIIFSMLSLLVVALTASAIEVNKVFYSLDYSNNTAEVVGSDSELGSATIPATITDEEGYTYTVTSIADNAFYGHSNLRSIELPNTIVSIGKSAFSKIVNFTYINIPNSVKSIGNDAFSGCNKLSTVSLGRNSTLTSIGSSAFYGCNSLRSFNIPNSVESIGASAFRYCSTISSINIPTSLTSIEAYTFQGTAIQSVNIPNSVTSIGSDAFEYCSELTSVTIGNSVTTIGEYAFRECSKLISVTIPNSVTTIGISAFKNCSSLTSVTIPNSVTSIGKETFYKCSSLTSVTIPNSVTSIGESAFDGCSGLTSVTIGSNVKSIGKSAFSGCTGELTVNCNIPTAYSTYNGSFYGSKFSSVKIGDDVETIGDYAFYYCSDLTSVTIGNSVTSIGSQAFYNCSGLTSVSIGNSVTSIGKEAFYHCSGLTELTIPNGVTSIRDAAFCGCKGLTSVTIPKSVTSIVSGAFSACTGELTVNCNIPNKTSSLFNGSKFSSVKIGDDVETVGDYAFYGCSELTSVTIGNSVKTIGKNAFRQISNITSLTIGNSVTSIGEDAFCGCSGLTSVTIPNSVVTIGGGAFYGCPGLTEVTIGNSVTSIGKYAFYNCSGLTSVTIPNSVTSIGESAFDGCKGLISVYCYAENVPATGSLVFYNVNVANAILYVPEASIETYKTSNPWNSFGNIVAINGDEPGPGPEPEPEPKLSLSASPSGGDVTAGTKVYLTAKANNSEVSDVSIYYTLNGTTPSKNSTAYTSSGITINASCTLKAIAYKDGYENSDVMEESYNIVLIDEIAINVTNFPDANFRKYLLEQDYGSDGVLTETEIAEIDIMNVSEKGIKSLKGIEFFTELTWLICYSNQLTSLDVSKNTALTELYCHTNQLTSLDLSKNTELTILACYDNMIKERGMDTLVNTLPENSTNEVHKLSIINIAGNDGNVCTKNQVAIAKSVGWLVQCWNGTDWQEYTGEGSEPEPEPGIIISGKCGDNVNYVLTSDSTLTISGTGAMYDFDDIQPWDEYSSLIKTAIIDNGVTSIGDYAFYGCYSLTEVTIPDSMKSIGYAAFYCCFDLTSVTIPPSVTSIGDYAFQYCFALTSLTIPNGVKSIGYAAFYGCSDLTSVTISQSVTYIGDFVFSNCYNLASVSVDSLNTVYDSRDNCNAIIETASNTLLTGCQNTVIPNSVTAIGGYAFYECSLLTSVTIPSSVTSIGTAAFNGCDILSNVYCYAEDVPTIENDEFYGLSVKYITLHVPAASIDVYKATEPWSGFGLIIALDEPALRGDVNGDGVVNGTDIQAIINLIVASEFDEKADVNGDSVVNGTDIQEVINIIVNGE